MKKFLTVILFSCVAFSGANAEENVTMQVEAATYSEAIAREFAIFNLAFGCSVTRDKFYSKQYNKSIVETCVDEVSATPDAVKDKIFEGAVEKKSPRKNEVNTYSMYEMLIVGKYHFVLGCYSAHLAAKKVDNFNEEAIIKNCAELSDLITPYMAYNFAEHQKKKKVT
jgi:hypothetical protein